MGREIRIVHYRMSLDFPGDEALACVRVDIRVLNPERTDIMQLHVGYQALVGEKEFIWEDNGEQACRVLREHMEREGIREETLLCWPADHVPFAPPTVCQFHPWPFGQVTRPVVGTSGGSMKKESAKQSGEPRKFKGDEAKVKATGTGGNDKAVGKQIGGAKGAGTGGNEAAGKVKDKDKKAKKGGKK